MKQYHELCRTILNRGIVSEDRTGTGTISHFGYQNEYDLKQGFPLMTTKDMTANFPRIVHELKWFLSGDTHLRYLKQNNVNIWDADAYRVYRTKGGTLSEKDFKKALKEDEDFLNEHGDLGYIYGKQWTSWGTLYKVGYVPARLVEREPSLKYPLFPRQPLPTFDETNLVGGVYSSSNYGDFVVLSFDERGKRGRALYSVQFLHTGYVISNVRADVIQKGNLRDPYYPTVEGVGFRGDYEVKTSLDKNLLKVWSHMLSRCYNEYCSEYMYYGAKGVFVCNRWLNFSNFREDVCLLPNWVHKVKNLSLYQLDKDYYNSNCYSPSTCVWLTKGENILYRTSRAFVARTPDGEETTEISQTAYAVRHGLISSKVSAVLSGKSKAHKGYTFRYLETEGDRYRYLMPVNQIAELLREIEVNPNSRRLLVSSWNVAEIENMALPPCHVLFQFYVRNGELSCQLYQRSADTFLGVPFNIASYALLTHLIAHVTGLEVGRFIHTFGDAHIYLNHLDQVDTVLSREPFPLPKLVISPELTDLFDFDITHISLEGYQSHGEVRGKVSAG